MLHNPVSKLTTKWKLCVITEAQKQGFRQDFLNKGRETYHEQKQEGQPAMGVNMEI